MRRLTDVWTVSAWVGSTLNSPYRSIFDVTGFGLLRQSMLLIRANFRWKCCASRDILLRNDFICDNCRNYNIEAWPSVQDIYVTVFQRMRRLWNKFCSDCTLEYDKYCNHFEAVNTSKNGFLFEPEWHTQFARSIKNWPRSISITNTFTKHQKSSTSRAQLSRGYNARD
jgi:hypothetical protein